MDIDIVNVSLEWWLWAQHMKNLSNTDAELKKIVAY